MLKNIKGLMKDHAGQVQFAGKTGVRHVSLHHYSSWDTPGFIGQVKETEEKTRCERFESKNRSSGTVVQDDLLAVRGYYTYIATLSLW